MVLLLLACTDSKNFEPDPRLQISLYKRGGFDTVARAWKVSLPIARKECRAGQLYKGGYWTAATRARVNASIPSRTLIVSAGLGVVEVNEMVPSYAATFTSGLEDSIPEAGQPGASERWWKGLGGGERLKTEIAKEENPRLICALPQNYLEAAYSTLVEFAEEHGDERLVVLGARSSTKKFPLLEKSWVELDARMIHHDEIHGTAGQLTARVLAWVLDQITDSEQINPDTIREMTSPLRQFKKKRLYRKGKRCTEEDVRAWIRKAWASDDPPTSATRALRQFRSQGLSFEQKKFGRVYRALQAEVNAS